MTEKLTYLDETLGDWTLIDSAKRLRGALLHCVRLMRRYGDNDLANTWQARIDRMPHRRMSKESINTVLYAACFEVGLIN